MSGVTIAKSLLIRTRDFLNLSFHVFPYDEILKVSKVKSDLIFEISTQISSEYQISDKSVNRFGSYASVNSKRQHPPPRGEPPGNFLR